MMDGLTRDYLEWCLKHPLEAAFRAVRWMNVDAEVLSRLLEEAGFRVSYSEGVDAAGDERTALPVFSARRHSGRQRLNGRRWDSTARRAGKGGGRDERQGR